VQQDAEIQHYVLLFIGTVGIILHAFSLLLTVTELSFYSHHLKRVSSSKSIANNKSDGEIHCFTGTLMAVEQKWKGNYKEDKNSEVAVTEDPTFGAWGIFTMQYHKDSRVKS
jgi:hypothetical protein